MPFDIRLDGPPIGFAVTSARAGTEVQVRTKGFISSEDGDELVNSLEHISAILAAAKPSAPKLPESVIDNLLLLIHLDGTARVYVNEISLKVLCRLKRSLRAGSVVLDCDIADIERLELKYEDKKLQIPEKTGLVFVFSRGWRKGLYFDLSPLAPRDGVYCPRDDDLDVLFGEYYRYLLFQHMFKITGEQWKGLLSQRWFPFIALRAQTIKSMLSHVKGSWDVDDLLERIHQEVVSSLPNMLARWESNPFIQPHSGFLKSAVERYLEKDYLSAASILYPRIEGIMRSYQLPMAPETNAGQDNLVKTAIDCGRDQQRTYDLLLPDKFKRYLHNVYFKDFNPRDPDTTKELSRHTFAHGVAPTEAFDLKAATLGLLIVDQLSYFLRAKLKEEAS